MRRHAMRQSMGGTVRAPQFGIPRILAAREVKPKRQITPGELQEMAKLLQMVKS